MMELNRNRAIRNPAIFKAVAGLLLGLSLAPIAYGAGPIVPIQTAEHAQAQEPVFGTPLTAALIDDSASAEEVGGVERGLDKSAPIHPLLWTQTSLPTNSNYLIYGNSSQPGPRHLRIGFTAPVAIGSVLVRGGGSLSVLRPGVSGKLTDDAQWIPAQRLVNGQPSTAEVDGESYGLWILPPGTTTRALRFTHVATQTDQTYGGYLAGVEVLSGRFTNLAPEATVLTSANSGLAARLTDEKYNGWIAWDNAPFSHPVTVQSPEWITLSWPHAVSLRGLAALWAGFDAAEVQYFAGPEDADVAAAAENAWRAVGDGFTFKNHYPVLLGADWIDFGMTIQTRAVRLRMTHVTDEKRHPHLAEHTRKGTRVWLGELMAVAPLAARPLQTLATLQTSSTGQPSSAGATAQLPNPPIPVHFTLDAASYVTLVIDDAQGNRVRNLVSDTLFPAGHNTVWWDGTDDLGRTPDAATHGVYLIPTHFVAPGTYKVRGLIHKPIDLHYEFSIYNAGHPGWGTADGTGGWLTNHTPPSATLYVPADRAPGGKPLVYLGSYVSEGGAGMAWVDLEGHKQGGREWVGGTWTGAPYMARDDGSRADRNTYAYVASVWGDNKRNDPKAKITLRLTGLSKQSDKSILNYDFDGGGRRDPTESVRQGWTEEIGGLAVRDNVAIVSLSRLNQLLFVDTAAGKVIGSATVEDPRGAAFDAKGNLLVLSAKRLLRFNLQSDAPLTEPQNFPQPQVLVAEGLEDPAGLAIDEESNLYISDRGAANQVKVFTAAGKPLRTIGHAGPSTAGPYDQLHMNNPRGLSIDSNHHLWVAEEDFQPKRVSVWTLDGKLINAFYGPSEYGGGGALDPQDKTRFYLHGMEFHLDWKAGTDTLTSVMYRPTSNEAQLPLLAVPSNVLYSNGRRYFTNSYLAHPTNGVNVGVLFVDKSGILHPAAVVGKAVEWGIFNKEPYKSYLPAGADLGSVSPAKCLLVAWSDINENGKVDRDELSFLNACGASVTIGSDPHATGPVMLVGKVGEKAMRFLPTRVTSDGIPVYDLNHGETVVDGAQWSAGDGGGQMLYSPEATVLTTAPKPFAREGVGGVDAEGHRWSYPSLWPGLHPGHSAPVADHPGELLATTRLLGDFIASPAAGIGRLWGINGNFGDMYLFTGDGLYITQLFQDVRVGKPWGMPAAPRGTLLNDISLHDENFYPSLTETADGKVYVNDGGRTSLVRVDGLDTLKRLPPSTLEVTRADLQKAQSYLTERERARQQSAGIQTLRVPIISGAVPALKDVAASLDAANWATIDRRIIKIGWGEKPDIAQAGIAISGGRLYAVYHTNEPDLLVNTGAVVNAPFKTGGALDLMVGADSHANPLRAVPVAGDLRLLVYQVKKQTHALLYRPVVSGTKTPVPFSSPDRTINIDQVLDVSGQVQLESDNGSFTFSIPLETLGLTPRSGEKIKADIGILRGSYGQTTQRVYWSNKATGITADVPSEAALTPALWGDWVFTSPASKP
jgi:hypothetical protein